MIQLECWTQRVFDGRGWQDVCYRHEHPERSIKASEMDDEGAIRLLAAICEGLSPGARRDIARGLGFAENLLIYGV